jgi:hypothetical protein
LRFSAMFFGITKTISLMITRPANQISGGT